MFVQKSQKLLTKGNNNNKITYTESWKVLTKCYLVQRPNRKLIFLLDWCQAQNSWNTFCK